MDKFAFHPELFEDRCRAIAEMEKAGFCWLSHYRSVDVLHDIYGLEVCGIPNVETAKQIFDILHATFPQWQYGGC
jgi:CheY-like chemotaxis protein